jgi:hypothetical protein
MEIGFDAGANIPSAVFLAHLVAAGFFVYVGGLNAAAGEPLGLVLNGLIGVLLALVGVAAARITARR